ncbi:MAG TPA: hypothetical protein PLL78_09245 [Fimbriimonadaceae bacterium]|nr:hypothetical protein [Fimbriimonadaceae bacterium]
MNKKKAGRPPKRTDEVDARLVKALKLGATRVDACRYAGISEDTLARWIVKYADFAEMIERTEAEVAVRMSGTVVKAGQNDPHYALKWLERRRRAEWSPTQKHELSGPDGGAIMMQFQDQVDRIYGEQEEDKAG